MIRHHPSDPTLFAYAAGTLSFAHARVVGAHFAHCAACRRWKRMIEEMGGIALRELEGVAMSEGALARTLARLDQPEPPPLPGYPTKIDELATGKWRWIAPGVRLMPLARRDAAGTRLDLIRVAPGVALPQHDHRGLEIICVLQGAFRDGAADYAIGDLAESEPGIDHSPTALDGEDCVCLLATTGRLKARSWVARLVQPFIGV